MKKLLLLSWLIPLGLIWVFPYFNYVNNFSMMGNNWYDFPLFMTEGIIFTFSFVLACFCSEKVG